MPRDVTPVVHLTKKLLTSNAAKNLAMPVAHPPIQTPIFNPAPIFNSPSIFNPAPTFSHSSTLSSPFMGQQSSAFSTRFPPFRPMINSTSMISASSSSVPQRPMSTFSLFDWFAPSATPKTTAVPTATAAPPQSQPTSAPPVMALYVHPKDDYDVAHSSKGDLRGPYYRMENSTATGGATEPIVANSSLIRTQGQQGRADLVYSWRDVDSEAMKTKTTNKGSMIEYYVNAESRANHGMHMGGPMATWDKDTLPIHISAVHTGNDTGGYDTQVHDAELATHAASRVKAHDAENAAAAAKRGLK